MDEPRTYSRFFKIGRAIAGNLVGQVRCRVELFAVEVQEEKSRIVRQAVRLAVAMVFAGIGFVFLNATLVVLAPADWRWAVLLGLGMAYLAIAGLLLIGLRGELQHAAKPFAQTLNELRKDRECLKKESTKS